MSDALLSRIAAGDQDAVEATMERYANLVWSLARRFTTNCSDAEDAVQEIFIELWSSAKRFDPGKATEASFIAMIARRRLIDRLRKTKRQPRLEDLEAASDIGDRNAATVPDVKIEAARAHRLIGELRPEQRQVIKLAVFDGYTHQGIANKLGLPLGTVKTHLRRGLLRVRDGLEGAETVAGGRF